MYSIWNHESGGQIGCFVVRVYKAKRVVFSLISITCNPNQRVRRQCRRSRLHFTYGTGQATAFQQNIFQVHSLLIRSGLHMRKATACIALAQDGIKAACPLLFTWVAFESVSERVLLNERRQATSNKPQIRMKKFR